VALVQSFLQLVWNAVTIVWQMGKLNVIEKLNKTIDPHIYETLLLYINIIPSDYK